MIEIFDIYDFQDIELDPDADYILMNHIDATPTDPGHANYDDSEWTSGGFRPLGPNAENSFTGELDGDGFAITGLYMNVTGDAAIFERMVDGYIHDLKIIDISVTATVNATGLANLILGDDDVVERVFISGTCTGQRAAGFVRIMPSSATTNAVLRNCVSRVDCTGSHAQTGGFVARHRRGLIDKCYSTGVVVSSGNPNHGFCGLREDGIITNSFWDTQTSGTALDASGGATGKTTAEMKDIDTFTDTNTTGLDEAWDFNTIWDIDGDINDGYPFLQVMEEVPDIPEIATLAATGVSSTSATLNGELSSLGEETEVDVFFRYREKGEGSWLETSKQELTSTDTFDEELTSLDPDTEYEFRAVVEWDEGNEEREGGILEFTTPDIGATVTTEEATGVTGNAATLNGDLTSMMGLDDVDVFFRYREAAFDLVSPYNGDQTEHHKAQFHVHPNEETPTTLAEAYEEQGYTAIMVSQKNNIIAAPNVDDIFTFEGTEHTTTPEDSNSRHMIAVNIDTIVTTGADRYERRQAQIDAAEAQGGVTYIAHPGRETGDSEYHWRHEELLQVEGYTGISIWSWRDPIEGSDESRYTWEDYVDYALMNGVRAFLFADDDTRFVDIPKTDGSRTFTGGWITIFSDLTREQILALPNPDAYLVEHMKAGNFYVQGRMHQPDPHPANITSIGVEDGKVVVEFDKAVDVEFITAKHNYYNSDPNPYALKLDNVTQAEYEPEYDDVYVRVKATYKEEGENDVFTWSNPIFIESAEEPAWTETTKQELTDTGTFDQEITDLSSETLYEFQAVVEWEDGGTQEATGDILVFETAAGSLSGTVSLGGSGVEGARVRLINQADNTTISTTTDEHGEYEFPALPSGQYHAAVEYDDDGTLYHAESLWNLEPN